MADDSKKPAETQPETTGDNGTPDTQDAQTEKTFTQAELDKIIDTRLKRAAKEAEARLEDERKKAAMSESERLAAQVNEAVKLAQDAKTQADRRVIQAEARAQAAALGVKPEHVGYLLRLTDLSAVTIGDDGEPNAQEITAAIGAVIKDFPLLVGRTTPTADAGAGAGTTGGKFDMNEFIRSVGGRR